MDTATETHALTADVFSEGEVRSRTSSPRTITIDSSGLPTSIPGKYPATEAQIIPAYRAAIKRAMDLVVSSIAIIILLPLLAGIALAIIATSSGPALFRQAREGLGGRTVYIYKFRTMFYDQRDDTGVNQTTLDDSRITTVGRFLRKRSLDELPQLFNVLTGDMSLVGPRPHAIGMLAAGVPYRHLVPFYDERLKVKPGITGWAQVNGFRGPTSDATTARRRIEHDIAYMQNQSLWLDIRIVLKTAFREFVSGSGS